MLLIIDDKECELFEAAFAAASISMVCLHSCKEALVYLKNNIVRTILTDLALPVMDGITFLEKLNIDEYRVGVLTGHPVDRITADILKKLGVEKIFIKGVDMTLLTDQVKAWVG